MHSKKNKRPALIKQIFTFLRKNYIITIFIACILFVGVVVVARSYFSKPTYIYVKVKVGQGLWWATTAKPPIWMVDAINKGDVAVDLLGKPTAEILSKKYFRYYGYDQFDVYLTMKLKVSANEKTREYSFKRSNLSVGSPIDIQFPNVGVMGTVISINKQPYKEKYITKTVYLSKRAAYPWEYDAIKVGDSYSDGEETILKVLDKQNIETTNITSDALGNENSNITEPRMYITVKVQMKLRQERDQLILGEDQAILSGKIINLATSSFVYDNYFVSKLE